MQDAPSFTEVTPERPIAQQGSDSHEIGFLPDRINGEPVIFIGMTDWELKLAAMVSIGFWLPVCVVIAALFGAGILGLGAGMVLAFGSMWGAGKRLRQLKRGRPRGYHVLAVTAWFEDHGLKPKTMIRDNEIWDIRRSVPRRLGSVPLPLIVSKPWSDRTRCPQSDRNAQHALASYVPKVDARP